MGLSRPTSRQMTRGAVAAVALGYVQFGWPGVALAVSGAKRSPLLPAVPRPPLPHAIPPARRPALLSARRRGLLALACLREAVARFITTADDAEALAQPADCAARLPRPPAFQPPSVPR